ncbi:phospholipase D-like domain-containing protein [Paracoccus spongiarum]|uniref:Phospholipase D n=1 Tax=Paracoccus spongiarum TaxID=3064387 RepID=A0ABT9JGJ5_9RHOB|nr:phospholipase D-like domain-containing protein [Paracoccus sp. 2205BS29-5]MDP5308899.1 phospholipase D-like domain-containing protein [Paracoccus sp. 2205BS29-5]
MDGQTESLLQPGRNCWRVEQAGRFAVIIDADNYFAAVREAMLGARQSILLIGWDFDARIDVGPPEAEGPPRLGDFILWLADRSPGLQIRLLRWDTGALKAMLRGNTLLTVLRWKFHPRITLRLDSKHPLASSHHQKIVVIDDSVAFCGGIDMTVRRWDRRSHLDDDPDRVGPDGTPHAPWHDATTAFDGAAAMAMGDLARDRWRIATGETLTPATPHEGCWPDHLQADLTDVDLAIARTCPDMPDITPVHEIEQMYLDLIAGARRMFYAESQYFASRRIARAIALRLAEPDGPEIVIVNPVTSDGWLESQAMDSARARLVEALHRQDPHGRLRILHALTERGEEIYIHAKVMAVDDRYLRVGSSNVNNRSMRLDSECDVVLAAEGPDGARIAAEIARIRDDLIAEHLGLTADRVAAEIEAKGSLIAAIDALRGPVGQGRTLADYRLPELNGLQEWMADNEILDPEGPEMMFESIERRGLFRGWDRVRGWIDRHRPHRAQSPRRG